METHPGLGNFSEVPTLSVSERWRNLPTEEQEQAVRDAIASFPLEGHGLQFSRLPSHRELILHSMVKRPTREQGKLLMEMEAHIRAQVGEPLELYCELRGDRNPQRVEVQARIDAWRKRREDSRKANLVSKEGPDGISA